MLKESGVAGADRVKSRQDFKQFLASYQHVLSKFPGFVSMTPSGSYNSNPNKQDFGDIDLIVHIQSDQDKATVKKELQAFFTKMPETVIVPFSSAKHAGKRTYNAGELISVRYHDDALGYSAQVDNIVALDAAEASFKQSFLDMPAEEQGLILGLTKIATIETEPAVLFQKLGIKIKEPLAQDQEYEFNLSGVELQLRRVTYEPGTFKQANREVLWSSKNFNDVQKLLFQYDLTAGFDDLLQQCKRNIRNPRSGERMKGVFASMISVKSGEVGTAKGAGKEAALAKIQQTFKENRSIFRSLMENGNKKIVFAFGRFQPPTIGHELLITSVKHTAEQQGADHAIYVSKTQDSKSNPLSVEQKISYLRKMFPGVNFVACDATVRTPIEAAKSLNGKYQELIMVAGSDRVANFEKLLNDYNGKEYQYAMLRVVSAGERDPDADDATGMSGTKMRAAAVANDLQTFMQGLPGTISEKDAMNLMELIKQGLQKPAKAKKGVAEAQDPNFIGFMNKTLGQKADAPTAKPALPDFMKNAPVAGLDSMGYKAALNFGMKTLTKLTPTQKTKLAIKGEHGVVNWLANQARKQGLLITNEEDEETQGKFMQEDLDEVQDFLPEVFKDPAIKSWAFVLTDGEPLPKAPLVGPFTVSINPGLPDNANGYANADWKSLDTFENLPDAKELAKGLAQRNPKQFVAVWAADHKPAAFYWPGEGWRGLNEGVAEGQQDDPEDYRTHLIKTLPAMMNYFAKTGKGWSPSKEQMLAAVDTAYEVMKHTGDVQQAGKALMDELNTLHRMSQGQQGVAEGLQKINWVKPNFDFEWHEVEEQSKMKQVPVDVRQYYEKHFPNKDAWLKAVQNGKAVVVPPDHAYEIRNAPFDKAALQKVLAPTGHEGPIGPAKEKRVNDLFDKGQVEMPIILKTSQGLWLIGGKTRLGTANYVKGLPAKVWLIGGKQGVAEGVPQPGKSSGKPISWIDPTKVVTKYLTLDEILKSIPGIPYYNDVVDDRDKKDFTWGVTKRVIQYAKELVIRPDAYKNWPPIIVLDGKLQDGAHRISTIYLMQQRVQPNNPIWKNAKLKVEFGTSDNVKQGVAEERTSAAVRMQRAADRQRAKSDASLRRTPSSIPKSEPKKDKPTKETKDSGSYAANKPGYSGEANYTAQPNWRGMNIGEDIDDAMARAIARLIESQLK
jgi:hypothetical protein